VELDTTGWRVGRRTRADAGAAARVIATFEDGPFYARSLLETRLYGETAQAIHESLSLDRFRAPWVQCLLPFRMPRAF
jgi:carotenoid 1,2-hydratase